MRTDPTILDNADKEALAVILDFVERWNKQDSEHEVAEAAQRLSWHLTAPNQKDV